MICIASFLLLLLLLKFAQPRLGTHPATIQNSQHRLLGRWSFDEPCIAGPVLYEDPNKGVSYYDINQRQYTRINGRLYEDESLSTVTTVYTNVLCNIIASPDHIICNYYMVDDTVGVFSLFSGMAKLDFSDIEDASSKSRKNGTDSRVELESPPIGSGRYVFQGGSDLHAGILGRVSTTYKQDIIKHEFCVQGSTYDHIIAPLN